MFENLNHKKRSNIPEQNIKKYINDILEEYVTFEFDNEKIDTILNSVAWIGNTKSNAKKSKKKGQENISLAEDAISLIRTLENNNSTLEEENQKLKKDTLELGKKIRELELEIANFTSNNISRSEKAFLALFPLLLIGYFFYRRRIRSRDSLIQSKSTTLAKQKLKTIKESIPFSVRNNAGGISESVSNGSGFKGKWLLMHASEVGQSHLLSTPQIFT